MGRSERILLADDDSDVRSSLTRLLETNGHIVVAEASSVGDVTELAIDDHIDFSVAIVDGNMPNVGDGKKAAEVIRELRKNVTIISNSSDKQNFGDLNVGKQAGPVALLEAIKKI